ncbi:MAG TPA: GNAT family N-acetyltransferase [Solirubrobacteraceae bacterium]|nr:GNAT family N-acetyltransferase [Solirubrobacteraceae bacterium]
MSAAVEVRRARDADVPALARMLARAFHDDPVAEWAYRHDALRPRALERFQAIRTRQLLPEEEVWTAGDHSCAALWAPPERWKTTLVQDAAFIRSFMHPRLIWRFPLVAGGWLALEQKHPHDTPHYYLAVLGTDPARQGQGLGSRLLAPVLQRCDEDGVGAFLESSKERNIAFYSRHGFRVVEEVRLFSGPPMWQMWRDPRP